MNPTDSIVVVGSLNMDVVFAVERMPDAGETLTGKQFTLVPGGKGANQAVACARLGGRVAMIGRVGADDFGTRLRNELELDAIDVTHVATAATSTGVALIVVDASAQNRIVVIPGANATTTPEVIDAASTLIDTAALVLLQLEIPLASVMRTVLRAAQHGRPIILNPAPAQPLPPQLLATIDYLVPNESEASALTGIDVVDDVSASQAAAMLRAQGVRNVLITLGARGVLIADAAGTRTIPAPRVQAIDTTAAGDTFIGAFAVALVEGQTVDAAAHFAVQAAALAVTRQGAQTSIPTRAELTSRI